LEAFGLETYVIACN